MPRRLSGTHHACAHRISERENRNAADKKEKDDFRRGWHFAIENWFAQPASHQIDNTRKRIPFQVGNGQVVSFFFFGSAPPMKKIFISLHAHDEFHVEYQTEMT